MKQSLMPMNLQFFAEADTAADGDAGGQEQMQTKQQSAPPAVDYAKIQQMLEGTLAAKEDTALKAYFKQQGLSQEEAEQAMTAFKAEKAKNQPDIAAVRQQVVQAQAALRQAQLESAAILAAVALGIDAKTIPYVLKMADLNGAMGQDGGIIDEALNAALNQVLEDVPALKPQAAGTAGFVQVGAGNSAEPQQTAATPQAQVASKRWNRFNN